MEFSDRLKNLRLSKKLTQEELSKLTGINKSSIGMYEAGKRAPKYAPLSVLADKLCFLHKKRTGISPGINKTKNAMLVT